MLRIFGGATTAASMPFPSWGRRFKSHVTCFTWGLARRALKVLERGCRISLKISLLFIVVVFSPCFFLPRCEVWSLRALLFSLVVYIHLWIWRPDCNP
jgi:hypothetical protein